MASTKESLVEGKVSKPFILELEEAKKETLAFVNETMRKHGLSCYVYGDIFGEIYRQLTVESQRELENAALRYAEASAPKEPKN